MNNIEKLKKIKKLSKPLINFIEQELNPNERIVISHQGFKLISEEGCLPKDNLNINEITQEEINSESLDTLRDKVNDLVEQINSNDNYDFNIISQNLAREEMIKVINYNGAKILEKICKLFNYQL